ncbi:class I SAM-dependent methyltransferase [Ruegeria sp. SCPT10]|uniref:class I SAM-dependent methyltransferase n=1 Tax=Ruegeria sp. SCP10 TaxID=3141377 RepID=UPI0033359B13
MDTAELDEIIEQAIGVSQDRHQLWVNLSSRLKCRSVCEVGVWKGQFAETLLTQVAQIEHYTLIDPWRNLPDWNKPANKTDIEFEEIRNEALRRVSPFLDKVTEIRDTTRNAQSQIPDRSLDLAYIDGDHTLRGITIDLHAMLPKIHKDGFIGGDDFTKTIWQHSQEYSPSEVFPYAIYFCEAQGLPIYTLPFNQFLIVNAQTGFRVIDHGGYATLTPAQIYARPRAQKLRKKLKKFLKA